MNQKEIERNYKIYLNACNMMREYLEYMASLKMAGISCDNEGSPFGNLINSFDCKIPEIIGNSMGMIRKEIEKNIYEYPVGQTYFNIWYDETDEDKWSIMDEYMITFARVAAKDTMAREKMWNAIVYHDEDAKSWINANYGSPINEEYVRIG